MLGLQAVFLERCLSTLGKLADLECQALLLPASEEKASTAVLWSNNLMFGCVYVEAAISSGSSGEFSVRLL